MAAVNKSGGRTESERILATLAERSFLNLWCYPNVYTDKVVNRRVSGKELCDLLVVFGDDVLVFSDKSIAWPTGDTDQAWQRWYRRAIVKSIAQVRGAERWIRDNPNRLFLDVHCTQRLPLTLPPPDRLRFHGIVVALGAGEACRNYFQEGNGSLLIMPKIADDGMPFVIGDVGSDGSFIHVLDDASLEIVLRELDTASDLLAYLRKKEEFIRSGRMGAAFGEEQLVAYFMTHMNSALEHDFTKPDGSSWGETDIVTVGSGFYEDLRTNPQYRAKKEAEVNSYVWDRLIEAFTDHMLAGTTILPDGSAFSLALHGDEAVRAMAEVPRYVRRSLGDGVLEALDRGRLGHRFTRAFLPGPDAIERHTGFFFMTLAVPPIELKGGYEQYREVRRSMLETYAYTFLEKNRELERVVGIACEPPKSEFHKRDGGSEDIVLLERPEWSEDLLTRLSESQAAYNIAQPGQFQEYAIAYSEWPSVPQDMPSKPKTKRQKRRAAGKSKGKKRRRR